MGGFSLLLDVEVRSEEEADEAINAGADIIMLDNMDGDEMVAVARRLKYKWKSQRKFLFETSGNITEANLRERAMNGVYRVIRPSAAFPSLLSSRYRYPQYERCAPVCATHRFQLEDPTPKMMRMSSPEV